MKRSLVVLTFAFILIGLVGMVLAEELEENNLDTDLIACTADAKLCDDGSYVGRDSKNNCEFFPCPGEDDSTVGNSCNNLYWIDNTNKDCSQKEFCGAYMYYGLYTFETQEECLDFLEEGLEDDDSEDNETETGDDELRIREVQTNYTLSREMVCCKVYGYGTNMEEVNVNYIITTKRACSIPRNFVGGNREIVDNSYCIEKIKERRQEVAENIREIIKERNRIRAQYQNQSECPEGCTCTGSTVKCSFENRTRVMTVYAGNSGNVIVQVKNVNTSTNVTLYKSDEGKVYGVFRNNETKAIILPDEAMEKLKERHEKRLQLYNESINLTEDGYYRVEARKKARLFLLIPVREHIHAQIDAETGETVKIRNPWWGFLARDIRTEDNTEETED